MRSARELQVALLMKNVLVILGAGASYDCANDGASSQPEWRPPLARQLFAIADRPAFEAILKRFPGAQMLAAELAEVSRQSTFSLERTLREYHDHRDEGVKRAFGDVPRYLGALLGRVSNSYTSMPGGYVRLAKALVADTGHQVECITLNYDSLFEQALRALDARYVFDGLQDYVRADRKLRLYKLHGCVNWHVVLQKHTDWTPAGNRVYFSVYAGPRAIRISIGEDYANPGILPVVTPPLANKTDDHFVCPGDHLKTLSDRLKHCSKLLVIGTSGMETHMLRLLASCLPSAEAAHFVGLDDVSETHTKFASTIEQVRTPIRELFVGGMRAYLNDEMFQRFLRI